MDKYYTLLIKQNGEWFPEFGSYSKLDVVAELTLNKREYNLTMDDTKIITTSSKQSAIDRAIKQLNISLWLKGSK